MIRLGYKVDRDVLLLFFMEVVEMNTKPKDLPVPSEADANELPKKCSSKYPKKRKDYENMMKHDSYRRVGGCLRQTRWGYRD